jgi:hypothetical protein
VTSGVYWGSVKPEKCRQLVKRHKISKIRNGNELSIGLNIVEYKINQSDVGKENDSRKNEFKALKGDQFRRFSGVNILNFTEKSSVTVKNACHVLNERNVRFMNC